MVKTNKLFDKEFLLAFGLIVGTAIGAGVFSLPYVASKSGVFPSLLLLSFLGVLTIFVNLMYGEITLRTKQKCRLVGYSEKYLGRKGKRIATAISLFSFYSSLLIYMILGGSFLHSLLSPFIGGEEFFYSIAIFIFFSISIYLNLSFFSILESWITLFLLFVIAVIIFGSVPHINVANFSFCSYESFFAPFGAILFSLSATSAIPSLEHIVTKRQKRIKKVISYSTVFYILIYATFMVAVLGVSGRGTSEEAFLGLSNYIGNDIIFLGFIFGLLAVITSYLMTGVGLKEIFWYDYGFSKNKAWFITCIVPLVAFSLGFRDFVQIISLAGSITGGMSGIMIILIFYNAKNKGDNKPAFEISFPKIFSSAIILVYIIGIMYQLYE